ncbi:MAG: hydrolase [Desulfosalsimonadaceae bacterium]
MIRHEFIATRQDCLLLVIDFQAALLKVMQNRKEVTRTVNQLAGAAQVFDIPILLTEQYPKGLGPTTPEVMENIGSPLVFQKDHFSACMEPDFLQTVDSYGRGKIVIVGVETHVCVLQTSMDLIRAGYQVHVASDAVASRTAENRSIALDLLRDAGAVITSTEIVIFQWALRANTEDFRRILPIVK